MGLFPSRHFDFIVMEGKAQVLLRTTLLTASEYAQWQEPETGPENCIIYTCVSPCCDTSKCLLWKRPFITFFKMKPCELCEDVFPLTGLYSLKVTDLAYFRLTQLQVLVTGRGDNYLCSNNLLETSTFYRKCVFILRKEHFMFPLFVNY